MSGLMFALNCLALPALTLGGLILVILGSWLIGRRRHWSRRQRVITALVGLALLAFWAYSPHFIVPPQPDFPPSQARLAAEAQQNVRGHLDSWNAWVLRMTTPRVVQGPEGYQACVIGYTYFYLPWFRYEVRWNRPGQMTGGTLRPWPLPCPGQGG